MKRTIYTEKLDGEVYAVRIGARGEVPTLTFNMTVEEADELLKQLWESRRYSRTPRPKLAP